MHYTFHYKIVLVNVISRPNFFKMGLWFYITCYIILRTCGSALAISRVPKCIQRGQEKSLVIGWNE
jgi:hypothetical protein